MRTLVTQRRVRLSSTPWSALIAAAVLTLLGGCRDEPQVVIENARTALEQNDQDGFLQLVTPRTADFLRQAKRVHRRSGKNFKVLRAGPPTTVILPKGDLMEPVIDGQLCTVMAKKGTAREPVILRLVRGQWRIDLLEMQSMRTQLSPMEP